MSDKAAAALVAIAGPVGVMFIGLFVYMYARATGTFAGRAGLVFVAVVAVACGVAFVLAVRELRRNAAFHTRLRTGFLNRPTIPVHEEVLPPAE